MYPSTNKKGANSTNALTREKEEHYAQKETMVANLIWSSDFVFLARTKHITILDRLPKTERVLGANMRQKTKMQRLLLLKRVSFDAS